MFTHIVTRTYNDGTTTKISSDTPVTDDTANNFDGTVTAGWTDHEIDWAQVRANLKSLAITCPRALTIKTNNSGSPADTIDLAAGQALVWALVPDGLAACPFGHDVTKLFVTLAAGADATLSIRALSHETV